MKRISAIILTIILAVGALNSCSSKENMSSIDKYVTQNEILTYEKLDKQKTQIIISKTGNIDIDKLCDMFEAENPDVQLIRIDITGGGSGFTPILDWLENGITPHIVSIQMNSMDTKYFEDLSAEPYINNYHMASLEESDVDGHIYCLPGPSAVTGLLYNKTMFDQYGWNIPQTVDEFIELCEKIIEDTDGTVEPWNPNGKYSLQFMQSFVSFVYSDLFAGAENRVWFKDYLEGKTGFTGHMEPLFELIKKFVDAGLVREEHFTYSATTRLKNFREGKIAILNMMSENINTDESGIEIGIMPFPGKEKDSGYLIREDIYNVYTAKQETTEKEKDAIKRFMTFISEADTQGKYLENSLLFSNVKEVEQKDMPENLKLVSDLISNGHVYSEQSFCPEGLKGIFDSFTLMQEIVMKMVTEDMSASEALVYYDKALETAKNSPKPDKPEPIPGIIIDEDFTVLETSNFIADMFRDITGADIGLVMNNNTYRGNVMRMFKGDVTEVMIKYLKPRSFDNDTKLIKVSVTGDKLIEILNSPVADKQQTANCTYAFSGLKCTVSPWNDIGSKMIDIKLEDGTDIDNDKLYTVAFWEGTVFEQYFTEVIEKKEGSFEEHMMTYMKGKKTLKPENTERTELIWEWTGLE